MSDPSCRTRLAGVDIGTLNCRLLIADLSPSGRLIEIRSERRILRLSEGVDQTKQLSVVAMDRVLQCLKEWREMIDALMSMLRRPSRRAQFVMQKTVMSFSIG